MIFIFSRCCLFLVSMQTCSRMSGKEGRGGDGAFVQVFCPKSQAVSLQCVPAGRCRALEGCKCWKSAAFHPVPVVLENLFFGFLGAPSSSSLYPAALHPCSLSCGFAGGALPLYSLSFLQLRTCGMLWRLPLPRSPRQITVGIVSTRRKFVHER